MECYASKILVFNAECRECLVYLILLQIRQIAKKIAKYNKAVIKTLFGWN